MSDLRRLKRSPRYSAFVLTGAGVGLALAVIGGIMGPGDTDVGRAAVMGYLALALGLLGAVMGAAAAVLWEIRGR